jgi:hypothetical protein
MRQRKYKHSEEYNSTVEEKIGEHLGGGIFELEINYEPYECERCGRIHDRESEDFADKCLDNDCDGYLGWVSILRNDISRIDEFADLIPWRDNIISVPVEGLKIPHIENILDGKWLAPVKFEEMLCCYAGGCDNDVSVGEEVMLVFAESPSGDYSTASLEFVSIFCEDHFGDYLDESIRYPWFKVRTFSDAAEIDGIHHHCVTAEIEGHGGDSPYYGEYRMVNVEHINVHPAKKLYYGSEWEDIRERVIRRDDFSCVYCGKTRDEHRRKHDCDLHVHHKDKFREVATKEEANKPENFAL